MHTMTSFLRPVWSSAKGNGKPLWIRLSRGNIKSCEPENRRRILVLMDPGSGLRRIICANAYHWIDCMNVLNLSLWFHIYLIVNFFCIRDRDKEVSCNGLSTIWSQYFVIKTLGIEKKSLYFGNVPRGSPLLSTYEILIKTQKKDDMFRYLDK